MYNTVNEKVNVELASTNGAVKLGVAVLAPVKTTVGPAVWLQL